MSFAYFSAGDVIFRQGDTGEHFYIILSGVVNVLVNDGGPDSVSLAIHFRSIYIAAASLTDAVMYVWHCAQYYKLLMLHRKTRLLPISWLGHLLANLPSCR